MYHGLNTTEGFYRQSICTGDCTGVVHCLVMYAAPGLTSQQIVDRLTKINPQSDIIAAVDSPDEGTVPSFLQEFAVEGMRTVRVFFRESDFYYGNYIEIAVDGATV